MPTASSAAPFFEALGCSKNAVGIIRLPYNTAAHLYPASSASGRSSQGASDFFISALDTQSGSEWQVALQLQLEGASSTQSQIRCALHSQQELEEAVRSRDALAQELAARETEFLQLRLNMAAAHERETAALTSNSSLLQKITKLESDLRFSENEKHELRGRLSQVAATADSEHGRLAATECALREQNTAQLKRIAVLEEREKAMEQLSTDHRQALEKLSAAESQLAEAKEDIKRSGKELHARIVKCESIERQLSMARQASAEDEKEIFAARAAAARCENIFMPCNRATGFTLYNKCALIFRE
jgi:chromosome segregation ATPase